MLRPNSAVSGTERKASVFLGAVARVERAVTFAAFLVLIVVLFGDVVSRELTGAGLTWARQLGVYANLLLTMAGIGIASAEGAHLRPRFADCWLPARWNPWLARLQEALMSAFCVAFAVVAALAVAETRALDERAAVLHWLVWPFQLIIPVVFAVASLRHTLFAAFPGLRSTPVPVASGIGTDAAELDVGRR